MTSTGPLAADDREPVPFQALKVTAGLFPA
jgi:hypothetical protein